MDDRGLAAWKLPPIVAAISLVIIAAFYVGGPALGMAGGSFVAGVIVVLAVRRPPLGPIIPARRADRREHLLVVVEEPLEDATALERIAAASIPLDPAEPEPEVRVVAAARNRFLDRWACDVGSGRERAQRSLVLTLASLARAGVDAHARIGEEDVVQTVTDQLREYPATEVFLVTGYAADAAPAAAELRSRLQAPFHHLRCEVAAEKRSVGEPPGAQSVKA